MRRLLILACAVVFIEATFFSILTPLLPGYKADHQLSEGAAGILAGTYAAGTLLAALPAGWLAARSGPRRATMAGLVGIGVFSPVFGFAGSIVLLDVSRFLQGAAGALVWVGAIGWVVSATPPDRRGRLIGTVMAAAVVGELLGAPLGAVAHLVGTGPVFSAVALLALILAAATLTIPEYQEEAGQGLGEVLGRIRKSSVPGAAVMLGIPATAFGLVLVAGPLRMDDLGAGAILIAIAFGCGSLVEAALSPMVGRFSDRVGRTRPYMLGVAVMAAAVVGVGLFGLLSPLLAAVILVSFGLGFSMTPAGALLTEAATAAGVNQSYASGAANIAFGGGQMVGAVAGGMVAGYTGFLFPCVGMAGILLFAGLLARAIPAPVFPTAEPQVPVRTNRR